jgi:hypothetical protein
MEMKLRAQEQGLYEVLQPLVARWKLVAGGIFVALEIAG